MLLPTIGINIAALSLTGFNFGAGDLVRVNEIWRTCLRIALLMMCVGAVVLFIAPRLWLGLFTESSEILDVGESLLRVEAELLPAYTTLFLGVSVLQRLKKPMFGMILGGYRLIVAPVILFRLFSVVLGYGLNGIWAGIFLKTLSGAVITWIFVKYVFLKIKTQSV